MRTWRRVADQLEQKDHKVRVPTLTGLGERSHLLRKDIIARYRLLLLHVQ